MLKPRNQCLYTSKNCESIHVKKSKNLEIGEKPYEKGANIGLARILSEGTS